MSSRQVLIGAGKDGADARRRSGAAVIGSGRSPDDTVPRRDPEGFLAQARRSGEAAGPGSPGARRDQIARPVFVATVPTEGEPSLSTALAPTPELEPCDEGVEKQVPSRLEQLNDSIGSFFSGVSKISLDWSSEHRAIVLSGIPGSDSPTILTPPRLPFSSSASRPLLSRRMPPGASLPPELLLAADTYKDFCDRWAYAPELGRTLNKMAEGIWPLSVSSGDVGADGVSAALPHMDDAAYKRCAAEAHKAIELLALMARNHPSFASFAPRSEDTGRTPSLAHTLLNCCEMFLMARLYPLVFQPHLSADASDAPTNADADGPALNVLDVRLPTWAWKQRDARLDRIAAALAPVLEPEHIELSVDPRSEAVAPLVADAISQLRAVASTRTPLQKLQSLMRSCRALCRACAAAHTSPGDAASHADNLFPLLVWSIVHAHCPQLLAHIEFVSTFRHRDLLVGESAYYLLTVSAACSFLETISSSTLAMPAGLFRSVFYPAANEEADTADKPCLRNSDAPEYRDSPSRVPESSDSVAPRAGLELLADRYRFINADAESLSADDVREVLKEYKRLAMAEYEADRRGGGDEGQCPVRWKSRPRSQVGTAARRESAREEFLERTRELVRPLRAPEGRYSKPLWRSTGQHVVSGELGPDSEADAAAPDGALERATACADAHSRRTKEPDRWLSPGRVSPRGASGEAARSLGHSRLSARGGDLAAVGRTETEAHVDTAEGGAKGSDSPSLVHSSRRDEAGTGRPPRSEPRAAGGLDAGGDDCERGWEWPQPAIRAGPLPHAVHCMGWLAVLRRVTRSPDAVSVARARAEHWKLQWAVLAVLADHATAPCVLRLFETDAAFTPKQTLVLDSSVACGLITDGDGSRDQVPGVPFFVSVGTFTYRMCAVSEDVAAAWMDSVTRAAALPR